MTDEISGSVASAGAGAPANRPPADPAPTDPAPANLAPADPAPADPRPRTNLRPRLEGAAARLQRWEIVAVFAVSLGSSGVYALVSYIGSLTAQQSLSSQTATLNGTLAPGRPLFGFFLQFTNTALALAPVLLVFYLLARAGERPASIGLDAREPVRDLARGAVIAALIGGGGLALYLIAYHSGVELNVVAESLPDVWWRIPILLFSAFQNAAVEEVVVIGYLLTRLEKLGVRPSRAIAIAALIRGSYHLYQGIGAFFGNAFMGVVFGILYRRWGRVTPLLIAHFLIDAVAFVGYALLAGHVGWLPAP